MDDIKWKPFIVVMGMICLGATLVHAPLLIRCLAGGIAGFSSERLVHWASE